MRCATQGTRSTKKGDWRLSETSLNVGSSTPSLEFFQGLRSAQIEVSDNNLSYSDNFELVDTGSSGSLRVGNSYESLG